MEPRDLSILAKHSSELHTPSPKQHPFILDGETTEVEQLVQLKLMTKLSRAFESKGFQ